MSTVSGLPETLLEAVKYFADPDVCIDFVAAIRWPSGPVCPQCSGTEHSFLKTRHLWKCKNKECRKQFSVKVGTVFEASPIGLDKWLPAVWLICNSKNGISSHELARATGLTQKTAWFVLHRIRLAMKTGSFERSTGEIEVDETFVGGRTYNLHGKERDARRARRKASGLSNTEGKAIVIGARERATGTVRTRVIPDRGTATLSSFVTDNVRANRSRVYTDAWKPYRGLSDHGIEHAYVEHPTNYVEGRVHTNGIENFWALLKRGLHGTYIQVDPVHLFRYLDERMFTYNLRDMTDLERFRTVLGRVSGRRLTYDELTGKTAA